MSERESRVCAITGGSSGIGLATALHFAASGDRVAICGRDTERLAGAVAKIVAVAVTPSDVWSQSLDVGQPGVAAAFFGQVAERWGRLDVVFNNAGYPPRAEISKISRQEFDRAIAVNVAATFEGVQAAWPIMASQAKGVIVNMSSMAAIDPFPGFSVYGACKAWIELFSKAIATEGEPIGIRVLCVRPGAVDTPMLHALFPNFPSDQMVTPEEVATEVFRLCEWSNEAPGEPITISKS